MQILKGILVAFILVSPNIAFGEDVQIMSSKVYSFLQRMQSIDGMRPWWTHPDDSRDQIYSVTECLGTAKSEGILPEHAFSFVKLCMKEKGWHYEPSAGGGA